MLQGFRKSVQKDLMNDWVWGMVKICFDWLYKRNPEAEAAFWEEICLCYSCLICGNCEKYSVSYPKVNGLSGPALVLSVWKSYLGMDWILAGFQKTGHLWSAGRGKREDILG